MVQIMFVTQLNFIPVFCSDNEKANMIIKNFTESFNQVTKDQDKVFWLNNENNTPIAMIRCSQVVGFYMREIASDMVNSQDKLANAQEKIANVIEKHLNEGEN